MRMSTPSQHRRSFWFSALCLGLLFGVVTTAAGAQAYEVFQTLRHVETGFESLDGVRSAALSPDGRHLYTGGLEALMVMERDDASGSLTPVQTLKAERDGFGVPVINHLVMSPDGLNLYAGSSVAGAVAVFSRNPADGRLTPLQSLFFRDVLVAGLEGLVDLEISPDGDHLYTLSATEEEVGVYARSSGDGTLTWVDVVSVNDIPELGILSTLAVSPAGDQVVIGDSFNGLLVFDRDDASGGLSLNTMFPSGASGVFRATDLIFSPDGDHLYVSGQDFDLQPILSALGRDEAGTLNRIQTLRGLAASSGWLMDADGANLYLTTGNQVTVMSRSPQGQLTPVQQLFQGIEGVDGLRGSALGALDGLGRHLYVPAGNFSSLAIFERQGDGLLAFQDAIFDDEGSTVDGLRSIKALHATRDGRDVYAYGAHNRVLTQFRRAVDGRLQSQQIVSLAELGWDDVLTSPLLLATPSDSHLLLIDRFVGAWVFRRGSEGRLELLHFQSLFGTFRTSFALDPQGRFFFAGSPSELDVWELDPDSGTLTPLSVSISGDPTFEWTAVDPAGHFVYGVRSGRFEPEDTVLNTYRWNADELSLTAVATLNHPSFGDLLTGLLVAPDGRHVLTSGSVIPDTGSPEAGLTVFETHSDGTLTPIQTLGPGVGSVGLNDPVLGSMSTSGDRLVAISNPIYETVTSTFFSRDPATGLLEILEQRSTGDFSGPSSLRDYGVLAWSPNGRQFYAFSAISNSLYAFDETRQGPNCTPGPQVLCLGEDGRFQVEVEWTDFVGGQGVGAKVMESGDSGLFWFFDPANWEMLVKVVDGCGFNGRHWVFAAATTNVQYTLTVTDTLRGVEAIYRNPLGVSANAVTDTDALNSCP